MPSRAERQKQKQEEKIARRITRDKRFRIQLAMSSFFWFFHIYFARYIRYVTAEFHRQIGKDLEDPSVTFLEILAFRGSAKSTLVRAYVIWAIITRKSRYVLMIGNTETQAGKYLSNIRKALEQTPAGDNLLVNDFGPFKPPVAGRDEWQKTSVAIPKYGARIEVYSTGQSIRGQSNADVRPDLIVCDDLEELKKVRFQQNRQQLYDWFKADVMQAGDRGTKIILIGNLLHSDGIMRRIEKEIKDGDIEGIFRSYEILDDEGFAMWPGKFPDKESLEKERRRLGEKVWQRECRLKVVPEDGQVVQEGWIKKFSVIPKRFIEYGCGAGVDLAISQKSTADCTAIVPAVSGMLDDKPKIYIGKRITNDRLSLPETVDKCLVLSSLKAGMRFFVESVGYQKAAIDEMRRRWLNVDPVVPMTDKRARLEAVAGYIRDGVVEFADGPATQDLITQLVFFGTEEHDDLVDAFCYLIMGLLRSSMSKREVVWI
jgi:predicted phage terminase large subunit-like protein